MCWANPLAALHPIYSNSEHTLRFPITRPWEFVSAAKFAYGIKGQNAYLGLENTVEGELNYVRCSVYSGQAKEAQFEGDLALFSELKNEYPSLFSEPFYPIMANTIQYSIDWPLFAP